MFENLRRATQARNFTTNVPKILELKSSSEQIFSENWRLVPLARYISETIIGVSNTAAVVCHLCHVNLLTVMTSLKLISRSSLLIPLFILTREARGRCAREEIGRKEFLFSLSLPSSPSLRCRDSLLRRFQSRLQTKREAWGRVSFSACSNQSCGIQKTYTQITRQGHPTSIFGKHLYGRRFEN